MGFFASIWFWLGLVFTGALNGLLSGLSGIGG